MEQVGEHALRGRTGPARSVGQSVYGHQILQAVVTDRRVEGQSEVDEVAGQPDTARDRGRPVRGGRSERWQCREHQGRERAGHHQCGVEAKPHDVRVDGQALLGQARRVRRQHRVVHGGQAVDIEPPGVGEPDQELPQVLADGGGTRAETSERGVG